MKVNLMRPFGAFSGKMAKLVYYIDKFTGEGYAREYVVPARTEQNTIIGETTRNLSVYYNNLSPEYLCDLKNYADRLNTILMGHGTRLNGPSMNLKMMYLLKKALPGVNLQTITPQEVYDNDLPVKTIMEAVETGLIPVVPRYEELDHPIVA